ncbi:hypothetical protein [Rhodoblastus sp.]|uniref:hypothetical protein n=1 Tax=Rhodoblastus sp. TaxID=1962975 RepID=UPI003F98C437
MAANDFILREKIILSLRHKRVIGIFATQIRPPEIVHPAEKCEWRRILHHARTFSRRLFIQHYVTSKLIKQNIANSSFNPNYSCFSNSISGSERPRAKQPVDNETERLSAFSRLKHVEAKSFVSPSPAFQ